MSFLSKRHLKIYFPEKWIEKADIFIKDLLGFYRVFLNYSTKRIKTVGFYIENLKNFLVEKLIWKRGRLTKPFIHTGLMFLLVLGIFFGPIIAERYPTLGKEEEEFSQDTPSSILNTLTTSTQETTTEESIKPRDEIITYKVKEGETLSSIAKKFFGTSSEIALNTIRWENNLKSDELSVGDELRILPVPGVKHIVESGETIYSIAKKYNTNAQKIVDFPFNYFRDEETFALNIGDLIIVPDGIKPEEKPYIPPTYYAQMPVGGGTGEFSWPCAGEITQWFTWYHSGIDIANSLGTAVTAAGSGIVSFVSYEGWGYGYHLLINHGTYQTLYAHLSKIEVSEGQIVSAGQEIGLMGSTGRSTGPHLHFEVRNGNSVLNPMNFLK